MCVYSYDTLADFLLAKYSRPIGLPYNVEVDVDLKGDDDIPLPSDDPTVADPGASSLWLACL